MLVVKALIIKNNKNEGPGLIGVILGEMGWVSELVELDAGEKIPDPASYSCIIVLGGPDSANDDSPKMASELSLVRKVLGLGIPYLGVCLGMQVLVKAAGGEVVIAPEREIGWRNSEGVRYQMFQTGEGRTDALCRGMPAAIPVFQLHGEMVVPSQKDAVLASGSPCPVQMVRVGCCAYGIQGHIELTGDLLRTWLRTDADLSKMNGESLFSDLSRFEQEYRENGRRMISNFLALAGGTTK